MNMNNLPGVDILSGFKMRSSQPLDSRQIVETIPDRNSLVTDNQAYAGLRVFVKAVKKSYIYNGETWDEIPNAVSIAQAMEIFTGPDLDTDTPGTKGLVPAPTTSDDGKFLGVYGWASIPNVSNTKAGLMTSAMLSKLNSIQNDANNYVHPNTHEATMITEDANHRFTTDTEKEKWNNKTQVVISNTAPKNMPTNSIFGEILKVADTSNPTPPPSGGDNTEGDSEQEGGG